MGPDSPAAFTLTVSDEPYLCVRAPMVLGAGTLEAALAGTAAAFEPGRPPAMIYWDGWAADEDRRIGLGRGGLDPVLLGEADLSPCIAVNRRALRRLVDRGALKSEDELARAMPILARSPGLSALWRPEFAGVLDPAATAALAPRRGPAIQAEAITLAITVDNPAISLEPFFAALRGQALVGQLDVIVLALGFDSAALRGLARALDAAAAADPRVKPRRYVFAAGLTPPYLANMAAGLANADAVVLADARCVPVTPGAVQHLADWTYSGDAVAACPQIRFQGRLAAAGLALGERDGETAAVAWADHLYASSLRTVAAPAPWFFAFHRSAWLASGGLRDTIGVAFWTAEFAFARGPRGRTVLVGSELVEWTGQQAPAADEEHAPLHRNLQAPALQALRDPVVSARPVAVPRARPQPAAPPAAAYSDPFPNPAGLRVLVFADAFGASQSIAFVEGLAGARARGAAAVRIIGEEAFPGRAGDDPAATRSVVVHHLEDVRPHVVVVSRLARADAWAAIRDEARRAGAPVLYHIDDDILDLPAVLGTERYRLARDPRRLAALREALASADLVLAATPALAERLAAELPHDRIAALSAGTAGRPSIPRPAASPSAPVVIGYMGSASHDHDLTIAAPALNRILADYPQARLVLFGSIAEQPVSRLFEGAVDRRPPVRGDYAGFRRRLADLGLDIGLAPLRDMPFNRVKTPTKWVEYAESGAAVLASPVGPYLPMIEAGAALAVRADQWESGLRVLVEDRMLRLDLVRQADRLLADRFGWDRLEREVMAALEKAVGATRAAA